MITTDTTDAEGLATWWAEVTGAEITETNDGWYVIVKGGSLPVLLAFQKVEEPTPGKNRIHLDLTTEDLEGATEQLLARGATLVGRRGDENFRWHTLADPQGNEFCIAGSAD
ncbi:glyoxalase [Knoellia subterranea KCTC 19937]|uniref:Glyoxalase n=2 Tax=Knoellia TaxID=136099 RepID=A0A0A0JJW8_9MICO|nr:glyoxalase [Knoellia subterranea KCTC 19937]